MTILFVGGEMGSLVPSDSNVIESASSGQFDPAFARCATSAHGSSAFADSTAFAAQTDCWIHFDFMTAGTVTSATKSKFIELLDGSDVGWIRVTADGSTSGTATFSLDYWTGAAWTSAGTLSMSAITLQTIDLHIVSNTASGSADLYVSGTRRIASGTIDLSGFSGVEKVREWGRSISIPVSTYLSQIVVSSTSTIGGRLFTVPVSGAGATSSWTGTYANIDEIAYSDADFINSDTANQVSTFAVTNPTLTGYTVLAVGVAARAKCGTGGPQNLQLALKSGATTYFGSSQALDAGYGAFVEIWETDPATSAAWVNAAVLLLQPGVKSIT